jgi:hypothetical protein
MKLSGVLPSVIGLIAYNPGLATIPLVSAADPDHNSKLQRALNEPGLAIVATLAAGRIKGGTPPLVHIESTVTLSVVENLAKNQTGVTAIQIVEQLLETMHRAQVGHARPWLRVDNEAFETGPIDGGLVVFFVNLTATSING